VYRVRFVAKTSNTTTLHELVHQWNLFGPFCTEVCVVTEWSEIVTVRVLVMLGKYFVSVKYVFACIKLVCVYVKLLKI
jgi:hypothetical protein